jgi:Tfp pilus assembly protein PilP
MKLATGILILGMGLGTAGAQNPSILDNTKAKLVAVQQKKTADSNAALAAAQKPSANPQPAAAAAKPAGGKLVSKAQAQAASQAQPSKQQAAAVSPMTPRTKAMTKARTKTTAVTVNKPKQPKPAVAVEDKKNPVDPKKEAHKTISVAGGRRDPFLSPVVNRSMGGSGCSTGKRCLAVDQIALTGIVKSEAGMIAVVINAMNKAYFLRENDPVFNGYVVKITGDSIIFKETLQDKLGKSFTREVTKKISTPAV